MSLIFVGRIMNWTEEHDVVFCREIIFVNPFSAKKKSVQRSALWQRVADTLNSIKDPVFFLWINAQFETISGFWCKDLKEKRPRN